MDQFTNHSETEIYRESRTPFIMGLLLLAALIGGGAYWFLSEDQTPAVVEKVVEAPVAETVASRPASIEPDRRVFFAYDASSLDSGTRQVLDQWAERLTADKLLTLQIEGHCDERGSAGYNLTLGNHRGNAVRDYLVAKGVNEPRLRVVSFGKTRPADTGHGEAAWAANRRVELRIANVVSQR